MFTSKKSFKKLNMYCELISFISTLPRYSDVTIFSNTLLKKHFPERFEQMRFEFESFAHGLSTVLYHDAQLTSIMYNKIKKDKRK